ncbi:MAG: lamin tail domain-containing protein [Polyangiaceae bacterium]|nr:lamin tail domain-containing protein [Polyangiaceae bacterium]
MTPYSSLRWAVFAASLATEACNRDFDSLFTSGTDDSTGGQSTNSASDTSSSGTTTGGGGSGGTGGGGAGGGGSGGTGGIGGEAPLMPFVVVNEVVADPPSGQEDWLELYNRSSESVDIGGWKITDSEPAVHSFVFPAGTTLDAGQYLVLDRDAANSFTFGFDKDPGDQVKLYDGAGNIVDSTSWVRAQVGQPNSWGRFPNGTGTFSTRTATKGAANQ